MTRLNHYLVNESHNVTVCTDKRGKCFIGRMHNNERLTPFYDTYEEATAALRNYRQEAQS